MLSLLVHRLRPAAAAVQPYRRLSAAPRRLLHAAVPLRHGEYEWQDPKSEDDV